mmetsp:Transcript_6027/g.9405  ORF Transcript_6027/g.9405 Transcript_6027/m.9405 type:complete len:213 (+) Transcript_6027:1539-2177(+)
MLFRGCLSLVCAFGLFSALSFWQLFVSSVVVFAFTLDFRTLSTLSTLLFRCVVVFRIFEVWPSVEFSLWSPFFGLFVPVFALDFRTLLVTLASCWSGFNTSELSVWAPFDSGSTFPIAIGFAAIPGGSETTFPKSVFSLECSRPLSLVRFPSLSSSILRACSRSDLPTTCPGCFFDSGLGSVVLSCWEAVSSVCFGLAVAILFFWSITPTKA